MIAIKHPTTVMMKNQKGELAPMLVLPSQAAAIIAPLAFREAEAVVADASSKFLESGGGGGCVDVVRWVAPSELRGPVPLAFTGSGNPMPVKAICFTYCATCMEWSIAVELG